MAGVLELAQVIACVHPQEYARLPLRLSRQLQLGAINEGLAFITRGVQAQLARGFPLDAAGALLLLSSFYCCGLLSNKDQIQIGCRIPYTRCGSLNTARYGRLQQRHVW